MNKREWPESVNGASVPYGRPLAELWKIASGPAPARWPAFYAIGRVNTDAAFAILSTFADDRDADARRTTTEVLGRLTDRPEFDSLVCRALRDSAGAVVRTACENRWRQSSGRSSADAAGGGLRNRPAYARRGGAGSGSTGTSRGHRCRRGADDDDRRQRKKGSGVRMPIPRVLGKLASLSESVAVRPRAPAQDVGIRTH
jgi:hypothetical protein